MNGGTDQKYIFTDTYMHLYIHTDVHLLRHVYTPTYMLASVHQQYITITSQFTTVTSNLNTVTQNNTFQTAFSPFCFSIGLSLHGLPDPHPESTFFTKEKKKKATFAVKWLELFNRALKVRCASNCIMTIKPYSIICFSFYFHSKVHNYLVTFT